MGFKFDEPLTVRGKFLLFLKLKTAPNFSKGSEILLKSILWYSLSQNYKISPVKDPSIDRKDVETIRTFKGCK